MSCIWRPETDIWESSSLSTLFIKIGFLNVTQSSYLHLLSAEVISRLSHLPDIYMGFGDSNSGLHVCCLFSKYLNL